MYVPPADLWAPQRRGLDLTINELNAGKDVCLYGPTGSGKSRQAIELMKWILSKGGGGSFYVNRKLLIGQSADAFRLAGLPVGIRAADWDDQYDWSSPIQICSADTECSRVYKKKIWDRHNSKLMVVDECFPAGIDVSGLPIEQILPGMLVDSFDHERGLTSLRKVAAVSIRTTHEIRLLKFSSGRQVVCTPSHPWWCYTTGRYIPACYLDIGDEVIYVSKTDKDQKLCSLRQGISDSRAGQTMQFGVSPGRLQGTNDRRGSRREFSQYPDSADAGSQKGRFFEVDRLVCNTLYKQGSGPEFEGLCPGGKVFNLEVEGNNNYFAGGYLVHNCHLQKTGTMKQIIADHKAHGGLVVGLTATPIGLSSWYDNLIVSGGMAEYRACKALVPAKVYTIEQPDLSKVKRSVTGEYVLDGKKRQIYTQAIVGSVIDRWRRHNPDARPTLLYAPGVQESRWMCEQFIKIGVNWAHIDATDAVVDGKRTRLTRPVWEEILERYKAGDIKGISNRLKAREGIDLPSTYHVILATPIGSLASYVQTCGRVLRYSPETPDHVIITCHGGNFFRHGSPNADRDWAGLWNLSERAVSEMNTDNIREGITQEPIRCPKCGGERTRGSSCPHCGFTHDKSQRIIIQEDGRMVVKDGHLIRPRVIKCKPDTAKLWERMFWGWRKRKLKRSFKQMLGYFCHKYGYHPPRNLPFMPSAPTSDPSWFAQIHTVPFDGLNPKAATAQVMQ